MKRTVLVSALSLAVAFGSIVPAYAQDVVINANGSVTVNTPPVPGQTFTAQLANGQVVTLQAAPATAAPAATTTTVAASGGAAAGGSVGATTATVATGGGLAGGLGLAALGALAAVGIVVAVSSASDTN